MKTTFLFSFLFISVQLMAQDQQLNVQSPEIQIKTAVLPAPEEDRGEAKVYGYDEAGELVVLREGSNNLVCLADDPVREGIEVSCYSKELDPFMNRGRELKAQGKQVQDIREIRKAEVEAGTLKMPEVPSMQYIITAEEEDYNPDTGELEDFYIRYVIYTPFATTESTGLPDKPHLPGMPWLMDPGTHRAHIMVTPER